MSHDLEYVDGRYCMAYSGEVPWHNLGKKVLPDLTPEQILKEAGLDWEVEKVPAFISDKKNKKRRFIGRSALVRSSDNKILTVTSEDWEPVQNSEAFDFFHDFVMAGDMNMHTAGSLRGGNMVWALAQVKDDFTVFGKDKVESYLLFSNPHEYGKCIDIRFTPVRVVCNNTLTLSLHGRSDLMVRMNHRKKFDAEKVKEILGITHTKLGKYKEVAEFLGTKKYTKDTLAEYFGDLFPSTSTKTDRKHDLSRPARVLVDIVETQPGANYSPGTFWNAYNAVTFGIDHLFGHNSDNRLYSSWYGQNRQKKITAMEKAVEMAKVA